MNPVDLTPSIVQREIQGWVQYLNEVAGVLCFTLAIGALGTNNPKLYGAISFIFVMIFHIPNLRNKAKILHTLSRKTKFDLSDLESHVLKEIRSQLTVSKLLVSVLGYLFLLIVAFGWFIFQNQPNIVRIIYGNT